MLAPPSAGLRQVKAGSTSLMGVAERWQCEASAAVFQGMHQKEAGIKSRARTQTQHPKEMCLSQALSYHYGRHLL